MKMYRSIGLVIAGLSSALLGVVAMLATPVLRYVAVGCEQLACGVEKLERDLAFKLNESAIGCDEISSDLKRESNGYRQGSAMRNEHQGDSLAMN